MVVYRLFLLLDFFFVFSLRVVFVVRIVHPILKRPHALAESLHQFRNLFAAEEEQHYQRDYKYLLQTYSPINNGIITLYVKCMPL